MNDWEEKGNRCTELKRIQQFTQSLISQFNIEPICFMIHGYCTQLRLPLNQTIVLPRKPLALGDLWGSEWDSGYFYLEAQVPSGWLDKELLVHIDLGGEALIYEPQSGRAIWSFTQGSVFSEGYQKVNYFLPPHNQPQFMVDRSMLEQDPSRESTTDHYVIGLYLEAAANGLFGMDSSPEPIRRDDPKRHGTWEARVKVAQIGVFDRPTWDLYLDMDYLIHLYEGLNPNSVRAQRILKACLKVASNHTRLGSTASRSLLEPELSKPAEASALRTLVVGHAHIDTAWLWPLAETRRKVIRTFASQLDLLKRYPTYSFGASAPHHYRWFQEDQPELFAELQSRVAEGRWELQGGMWIEPDCNLISGESLVRQILHGQRYWSETFGKTVKTCWIPDVFGYSAAMPQILRLGGLEFFLTQKMSWSKMNPFPHDTFYWKGLDGTKVLTHFPPEYTYNSFGNPEDLRKALDTFQEKADLDEFMTLVGIGNGGGGPKEEHLEHIFRSGNTESVPKAQFGTSEEFFLRLRQILDHEPQLLAEWKGELYLEYHRGTYTTQAMVKKNNRLLEEYLAVTESLWTWVLVHGSLNQQKSALPYPTQVMDEMVKTMLLLQFHDILPGSSIHQVYLDSLGMYLEQFSKLIDCLKDGVDLLFPQDDHSLVIFNSSDGISSMVDLSGSVGIADFAGTAGVRGSQSLHEEQEIRLQEKLRHLIGTPFLDQGSKLYGQKDDGSLKPYKVHRIPRLEGSDRLLTWVELPCQGALSLGLATEPIGTQANKQSSSTQDPGWLAYTWEPREVAENFDLILRNSLVTYQFLSNGSFHIQGQPWALNLGNLFELFEDTPHAFEAWDIDHYYPDQLLTHAKDLKMFRLQPEQRDGESGWDKDDLIQGLRFELTLGESTIYQDVFLNPYDSALEFDTKVDWKETRKLLRVSFPVDPQVSESNSDIFCGFVSRSTGTNTSWDQAKFEFPARTYVDVSGIDGGCALISDSKYGFSCRQGRIGMSLLRAPLYPDPDADIGIHHIRYLYLPHQGDLIHSQVQTRATLFNRPPLVVWGRGFDLENQGNDHQQELSKVGSVMDHPIRVLGAGIRLMALKPAEDRNGWIIRICENHGRVQKAVIQLAQGAWKLEPVDILEQPMTEDLTLALGSYPRVGQGVLTQSSPQHILEHNPGSEERKDDFGSNKIWNIRLQPFEIQSYRLIQL